MSDILARLAPPAGAVPKERREGRGRGSTQGKTCGRGFKGQKARNGGDIHKLHFEGGQTPIQRRLPKRGFRVPFPKTVIGINVGTLERFEAGSEVDEKALRDARLVQPRRAEIKILGEGELSKKLVIKAQKFSKSAIAKIEAAGGQAIVVGAAVAEGEGS